MFSGLAWQPPLFGGEGEVGFDPEFTGLCRRELGGEAWLDVVPGWLSGADELFTTVLAGTPWQGHEVRMYDNVVPEPRLTCRWTIGDGAPEETTALPHPVLSELARALSGRYEVNFTQVGANLYRNGADSVAWHGDRIARELASSVVALVSLGAARPFRLRPKGGGPSIGLVPGPGDLVVMGGSCQRMWQHAVPKVRSVGPRVSLQFRHAYPAQITV